MTLEGNLLMAGVSFRDQHRDLRMDIDNMSYEVTLNVKLPSLDIISESQSQNLEQELLALEEEMGTVSTALPEEALTKCLQRTVYWTPLNVGFRDFIVDQKCSVCQVIFDSRSTYLYNCLRQWGSR